MGGKKGQANGRKLKKETVEKVSDEECFSESQGEEEQEIKSTFLNECEKAFGVADFYVILKLEKENANASDSKLSKCM